MILASLFAATTAALAALGTSGTGRTAGEAHARAVDAHRGRAVVTVYDEGAPFPDRWVVFHDADGNVIASMKTGKDGKASADVPPNAMITVAHGVSIQYLVTVVGVQPGDEVVVGEKDEDESVAKAAGVATVHLPGKRAGATRYTVTHGVGATEVPNAGAATTTTVLERFLEEKTTKFPVLAEAWGEAGRPVAYSFAWGALDKRDDGKADVRLPAWSTDWRKHEIVLTNVPAGVRSATAKLDILTEGEDRFERPRMTTKLAGKEATLSFDVPSPLGKEAEYAIELEYGEHDEAKIVHRDESLPLREVVDLAKGALPHVKDAITDASGTAARPTVAWTLDGDPKDADVAVVRVGWPKTHEHLWTIYVPPGTAAQRVRLPALPAELAKWQPDGRPMTVGVGLVDASFFAGFDDVKKKGLQLLEDPPEEDEEMTIRTSTTGDIEL